MVKQALQDIIRKDFKALADHINEMYPEALVEFDSDEDGEFIILSSKDLNEDTQVVEYSHLLFEAFQEG